MKKPVKKVKTEQRGTLKSLIIVVCIVFGGVFAFLMFYNTYIDRILYAERLSQMREVTTQLFSGLEDVVKNEWKEAENQSRHITDENPKTLKELLYFMQKEERLNQLDSVNTDLIAVDNKGNYYTQAGRKGLLKEKNYLMSKPERISFVSNFIISDDTRMIYLKKFSEPMLIKDEDDTIVLEYYGVSQSMTELSPYFDCSAYDGRNSMYVVDSDGLKLFGSGNENLLKGYNVYSVLNKMNYLHGSSFTAAKKELEKNNISYSNAILDNKEVYYAMYHMESARWTLIFMVPSKYVAMNTVDLVNITIRLVLVFAVFMVVVSGILIFWILKKQQKLAVEAERRNSMALEKLNGDLEKAVQEADAASKAKSDFLANMSHDIRTPMNAIVGITGLMEHEAGISDKMLNYIEKVQLSSKHLLGLINDILDMSRIESNEVTLNVEHVSLAEQIGQIDSMIRAQTNEHRQNFHIHINEIIHEYLICDGVRLRQITLNLLSNAVKYTPEGGDITLDFREEPCEIAGYARFHCTVTDSGYGMSPEFITHIFEPFTRAESSITNKVQGTGLGMAITKNIVDLMGGEIHVESEIGKGSRFEVILTLPIDKEKNYSMKTERILLISDEERLVRNVKASVKQSSVQLSSVTTEEEAVKWLTQKEADIILLSGCTQNKTLKETVDLLRQTAKNAALLFCVDYIQDEHKQEEISQSGVDGIVLRPFFLSNLEMALARIKTHTISESENESILKGMKFLCAEDNELNAEILQEILHMYDAECTIYSNGEEIVQAFQDVKQGEYDVILMDIQMPKMNGLEAARAIRSGSNPLGSKIPIIAMTANAFSEDVQHCLSAGMDAHIAKPLDIAMLEKTLRGFVSGGL